MKEPDELRLQVDFPFMERAVNCDNDDGATIYQRYGCECHSGWFDLIHSLCSDILLLFRRRAILYSSH